MSDQWKDFQRLLIEDPSFKLTPQVKDLFVKYAGIPEDQVAQHVKDVVSSIAHYTFFGDS